MPRKGAHAARWHARRAGFNEAGAFMPRKGRPPGPPYGRRAGFNEAGAFMPRKGPGPTISSSARHWLQ